MTKLARFLFIAMAVGAVWLLFGCHSTAYPYKTTIVTERGVEIPFNFAVAKTEKQRELGLSGRKVLPRDSGMIFLSEKERVWYMWMKNTYVPLDMVFLDKEGKITKIHANAEPESLTVISSDMPVKGVLEVSGGLASYLGIKVGDKVSQIYFN
ncbi:MAG: DUF192 domain-containing protein [Alphaproteobacteria bacterium]|nr:DUF192 domain-containing protein [Alphaproteobacteria bacterium]